MNRRSFLKLSLSAAAAAFTPSLLTAAISKSLPLEYKGWSCRVDELYNRPFCKQVYWTNGTHHSAMLFDDSISVSEMIKRSKTGLDMAIKRAERFGNLTQTFVRSDK